MGGSISIAPIRVLAVIGSNLTINAGNVTVNFMSMVSGGTPPYTYAWNLGNGVTSTLAFPPTAQHYNKPGLYKITLDVIDAVGTKTHTEQYLPVLVVGLFQTGMGGVETTKHSESIGLSQQGITDLLIAYTVQQSETVGLSQQGTSNVTSPDSPTRTETVGFTN